MIRWRKIGKRNIKWIRNREVEREVGIEVKRRRRRKREKEKGRERRKIEKVFGVVYSRK